MKKGLRLVTTLLVALVMIAMPVYCMAEAETVTPAVGTVDLTPIFQAIIALLAALVTVKVIPWIKGKTTSDQQAAMLATVRTLVFAAEQIYGAGKGDKKREWVEQALLEQGYNLDTKGVMEMIEANVRMLTISQNVAGSG